MRKAFGRAAVALTAAALSFHTTAFADGYGCASCYGPPSPPPCPTQQAPCCQQPSVQHVHYHQKHCLFGHHAPMMMPMTAPVVQVPMAVQPVVAAPSFAVAAPSFATVAAPSFAVAAAPSFATVAAAPSFAAVSAAPNVFRISSANISAAPTANISAASAAGPSNLDLMLAQMTQQADRAQAAASSAQASNLNVQTQLDGLRSDVDALNRKFENLKACIAACVQNNNSN